MSCTKPELASLAGRLKRFVHKLNTNVSSAYGISSQYKANVFQLAKQWCVHFLTSVRNTPSSELYLMDVVLLYLNVIGTFVISPKVAAPTCTHFASKARPAKIKLRRLRN